LGATIAYLKPKAPQAAVVSDSGSGLSFKRQGLRAVLERSLSGAQRTVGVADRDRLARVGFEPGEWLIQRNGGQIVVLSQSHRASPADELTQDTLAILAGFAGRLPGLRKYRDQIVQDKNLSDGESAGDAPSVVRRLALRVQPDYRHP
jgi:putative resolvase